MLRFELTFLTAVLFAKCFPVTIFEIDDEVTNFNLKT
jgi:hypothetical protein